MRLRGFALVALGLMALGAWAAEPTNATLAAKAQSAMSQKEWASAQALYLLLEDREPENASAYAGHMVASEMRGQRQEALGTLTRAIHAGVPLDSVLDPFRSRVRMMGEPQFYPELLKEGARELPYMSRVFDARLLDYYAFRRNTAGTIEYANKLLTGLPTDTRFLLMLGEAYMDQGNMPAALDAWERVLAADPRNFYALTAIGNYLYLQGSDRAFPYLERAYAEHPTPFVARLIGR